MRMVDLHLPNQGSEDPRRLAALTRHLNARLLDFVPGGPEVVSFDERSGLVKARFPGHDTALILRKLKDSFGISAAEQDLCALFCLNEATYFEDLDYVWGCLFDLLA